MNVFHALSAFTQTNLIFCLMIYIICWTGCSAALADDEKAPGSVFLALVMGSFWWLILPLCFVRKVFAWTFKP